MLGPSGSLAVLRPVRHGRIATIRSFLTALEQKPREIRLRRALALPAQHMLDVVSSVEHYGEFLPYCRSCVVNERDSRGYPQRALMSVGWQNLTEEFESIVSCDPQKGIIISEAADSKIFSVLLSQWTIKEISEGRCSVELILKFKFQSALYNSVTSTFGPTLAKKMVEAFSNRARKTYKH